MYDFDKTPAPADFGAAAAIVVIDLEATTSNDRSLPGDEMETIEIGAVLVRIDGGAIVDRFQTFVRPVRHPELTPFCTELTGITQAMVDDAPEFPAAAASFRDHLPLGDAGIVWGSWGLFDKAQLARDCAYHELQDFLPAHFNLKKMFSANQGTRRRFGMKGALGAAGLALDGQHHRALDDALNIVKLLPWITGTERI